MTIKNLSFKDGGQLMIIRSPVIVTNRLEVTGKAAIALVTGDIGPAVTKIPVVDLPRGETKRGTGAFYYGTTELKEGTPVMLPREGGGNVTFKFTLMDGPDKNDIAFVR
jgi:hypothetical protein